MIYEKNKKMIDLMNTINKGMFEITLMIDNPKIYKKFLIAQKYLNSATYDLADELSRSVVELKKGGEK